MLRIGKLSGKIYDDSTALSSIGECCIMVEKEDVDEELKRWKMARTINDCDKCRGCPEYYRES